MPCLRDRLRSETRSHHQALEEVMPLARGEFTRETYRDHLRFLLSFHAPVERCLQNIEGLSHGISDLERRWKTSRIESDLGEYCLSRATPKLRLHDVDQAVGAMYVIEGATLGARILIRQLTEHQVLPGEIGSRYIEAYGKDSGRMWRKFCDDLSRTPAEAADSVVHGAITTFAALVDWRDRGNYRYD